MPDITQRIADILQEHVKFACTCGCGVRADCTYGHANYVAEVLTTELGLRQEWSVGTCGKQVVMSEGAAKDKAARWPESFEAASRYVTEWVPE